MQKRNRTISVVIPIFNGGPWIYETLTKLGDALAKSPWALEEIIIVDDGSTDETVSEIHRYSRESEARVMVISQENLGRFIARKNGLKFCEGEFILFLDSRVHIHSESLKHAYSITESIVALTCHIEYSQVAPIVGFFWSAAEKFFWREYWKKPQDSLITKDNFDNFPKGTTSLILRRDLAVDAFTNFKPTVSNLRNASDDTQPLYMIAEKSGIFISPKYSATYIPRENIISALKHAHHRGSVFYDGHLSRRSGVWKKLLGLIVLFTLICLLLPIFIPIKYFLAVLFAIDFLVPIMFNKSMRWKPWISLNMYILPFAFVWSLGLLKTIIKSEGNVQ